MEAIHEEICSIGYAGLSVINAIPSGIGSTVAIDIVATVCARSSRESSDKTGLIGAVLDHFRSLTGMEFEISIDSEVPQGRGLKSSSAVSVAAISALSRLTGEKIYPPILSSELSRRIGLSVTGAFDDAVSAYHGGCFLTDNHNMKIMKELKFPDNIVFVISSAGERPVSRIKSLTDLRSLYSKPIELASSGRLLEAMNLNGHLVAEKLGYDMEFIGEIDRISPLASGVSGNGPAIFAAFREGEEGPGIELMSRKGNIMLARAVGHDS